MNHLLRLFARYLNSRRVAAYVLAVVVVSLTLSGFLPSEVSTSVQEWETLARERPVLFRLASLFSTPRLVRSLPFLIVSAFLFLSTVACTINRLRAWFRLRVSEFERETAFSFEKTSQSMLTPDRVQRQIASRLRKDRWKLSFGEGSEGAGFTAHRGGGVGFWGSIVFHLGLLICFLAIPVSAATVFRGQFLATNEITTPLKQGLIYTEGASLSTVPDIPITIRDLEGTFAEGLYKVDFRAVIETEGQRYPVAVNQPANIRGFQFTLHEFGYSPNVLIRRDGEAFFDYYLNLRHGSEGDVFDIPSEDDLRLSIVLMPDFFREGNTIGSRSNNPSNPVLLVRFFREEAEVGKGLVPLGEEAQIEGFDVKFQDLSRWANFIIVRERGVPIMILGMLAGVLGLLVRFLSNERVLEFRLESREGGALIRVLGYSKYYPAFLEREVTEMTEIIEAMGT